MVNSISLSRLNQMKILKHLKKIGNLKISNLKKKQTIGSFIGETIDSILRMIKEGIEKLL